jgi:hypothetical protein
LASGVDILLFKIAFKTGKSLKPISWWGNIELFCSRTRDRPET